MHSKASIAALFGAVVAVSAQPSAPTSASASTTTSANSTAKPTGPVVTVLFPEADQMQLEGSIVNVDAPKTTLVVNCPKGTDSDDCGVPEGGMTITQDPSQVLMSTVIPVESGANIVVTYGWDCSVDGTKSAECTYVNDIGTTGSADPTLVSSYKAHITEMPDDAMKVKYNETGLKDVQFPVAITAGAEKLSQTGSANATGGPANSTGAAATLQIQIGGLTLSGALAAIFML